MELVTLSLFFENIEEFAIEMAALDGVGKAISRGASWAWGKFFGASTEVAVTTSTEVATKTSTQLLLKPGPANLTQKGLDHIVARHWFSSGAKGAGKFVEGTTGAGLKDMINTTTTQGVFRANTAGRVGTIAEHNFGRVIGTTSGGAPASNLRVVIGSNGNVITAFPY